MTQFNSRRALRIVGAIAVAAFVATQIGLAEAATAGRGNSGGSPTGAVGGNRAPSSAVILVGSPGNCPPTIACPDPKPPMVKKTRKQLCGDYHGEGLPNDRCRLPLD